MENREASLISAAQCSDRTVPGRFSMARAPIKLRAQRCESRPDTKAGSQVNVIVEAISGSSLRISVFLRPGLGILYPEQESSAGHREGLPDAGGTAESSAIFSCRRAPLPSTGMRRMARYQRLADVFEANEHGLFRETPGELSGQLPSLSATFSATLRHGR